MVYLTCKIHVALIFYELESLIVILLSGETEITVCERPYLVDNWIVRMGGTSAIKEGRAGYLPKERQLWTLIGCLSYLSTDLDISINA